jgi:peptide/nickel transport system permease protein
MMPGRRWARNLARQAAGVALTLLVGGFLAATLVRLSPGFGLDERELDARFSAGSLEALREERAGERNIGRFYVRHMAGMLRGELGYSASLGRPIGGLISERAGVTAKLMVAGVVLGWTLALALAVPAVLLRSPLYRACTTLVTGLFLCVPSAALALLLFFHGGPVRAAIALVIFPKVFQYLRNLLEHAWSLPHVLAARAKGLRTGRILIWHVLPSAAPEMLALAGVSVSMALGAAIPVEVICDLPGIGQLAWKAAVARDLPVLVNLTLLIALVTQLANSASDAATGVLQEARG